MMNREAAVYIGRQFNIKHLDYLFDPNPVPVATTI